MSNIATIYSDTKDFQRALEYFEAAEKLANLVNDEMTLADCSNGRAMIYEQQGKNREALELYKKTLEIYKKLDLPDRLALTYNNMGIVYKQLDQLNRTIFYYNKALELAEEIEANYIIAALSANLANVYLLQNQYEKAITANLQAHKKAREIGAASIAVETYGNLMDVYSKMNNYQKAYEYAVLYKKANDSLINVERTAQLAAKMITAMTLLEISWGSGSLITAESLSKVRKLCILILMIVLLKKTILNLGQTEEVWIMLTTKLVNWKMTKKGGRG